MAAFALTPLPPAHWSAGHTRLPSRAFGAVRGRHWCSTGARAAPATPIRAAAPERDAPAAAQASEVEDVLREPLQELQPPHSGYHWRGQTRRFFEGWYFRITLPQNHETVAFMYSIEDPAGGAPCSLSGAQILGPRDEYVWQTSRDVGRFWAWPKRLGLGNWFEAAPALHTGPARPLPPDQFEQEVREGYQVTARLHQGCLRDKETGDIVRWRYRTRPAYGYGAPWGDKPQKSTASWVSSLQAFEPGWQVLMAHGFATGYVDWRGERFDFVDAPAYSEKNWGGAFPTKWFWMNCNLFEGEADLALTVGGGLRGVPWQSEPERAAMIAVHHAGRLYEFVPWNTDAGAGAVSWRIDPWGRWHVRAEANGYVAEVTAWTDEPGCPLRAPTREGLVHVCRDAMRGRCRLVLARRGPAGAHEVLVDAVSDACGVEVGGGPWEETWRERADLAPPLKLLMNL
eukprot:tig00020961_g16657.t1